jgi:hypothetical protein
MCDALAGPAIAVACLEAVAVEEAGNQIVAGNQHQLTHGLDDIGRGAVALPTPALGQAQLAVGATHPVDDENDLGGRVVDIGHDLVDQSAHDALLDTCIGRRRRPGSLQIGGERRKRRWISGRHRPCSVVGGNLAFHLRGMGKRLVPASTDLVEKYLRKILKVCVENCDHLVRIEAAIDEEKAFFSEYSPKLLERRIGLENALDAQFDKMNARLVIAKEASLMRDKVRQQNVGGGAAVAKVVADESESDDLDDFGLDDLDHDDTRSVPKSAAAQSETVHRPPNGPD